MAAGDVLFGKAVGRVKGDQLVEVAKAVSPALEGIKCASGTKEGFLGRCGLGHVNDDNRVCKGSIVVLRLDASVAAVEDKSDCICCPFGAFQGFIVAEEWLASLVLTDATTAEPLGIQLAIQWLPGICHS